MPLALERLQGGEVRGQSLHCLQDRIGEATFGAGAMRHAARFAELDRCAERLLSRCSDHRGGVPRRHDNDGLHVLLAIRLMLRYNSQWDSMRRLEQGLQEDLR